MANVTPVVVSGARHVAAPAADTVAIPGAASVAGALTIDSAAGTPLTAKSSLSADLNIIIERTGGTASVWNPYLPAGTTDLRLFANGADRVTFKNDGKVKLETTAGLVSASAALATTATTGFLYIPTCAGAPTGTPVTETGTVAMVFDTTNNKLMVYDGGWIGVTLA